MKSQKRGKRTKDKGERNVAKKKKERLLFNNGMIKLENSILWFWKYLFDNWTNRSVWNIGTKQKKW